MDNATAVHTLPVWIWLSCAIIIVGVVTLIYSQGNWRTTSIFVGLALLVTFLAAGYDSWNLYLNSHFIGEYDLEGVPHPDAGPGWSILWDTWPLWLLPSGIAILLVLLIERSVHYFVTGKKSIAQPLETTDTVDFGIHDINKQLELTGLKQEITHLKERLATTIAMAEQQIDSNLNLEIKMSHLEDQQQKELLLFNDKIATLELELEQQKNKNQQLIGLTLQQAEQIVRLESPSS